MDGNSFINDRKIIYLPDKMKLKGRKDPSIAVMLLSPNHRGLSPDQAVSALRDRYHPDSDLDAVRRSYFPRRTITSETVLHGMSHEELVGVVLKLRLVRRRKSRRMRERFTDPSQREAQAKRMRERHKDPKFRAASVRAASENMTRLHQDAAFAARRDERARELMEMLNQDPTFAAARDLRIKALNDDSEFAKANKQRMIERIKDSEFQRRLRNGRSRYWAQRRHATVRRFTPEQERLISAHKGLVPQIANRLVRGNHRYDVWIGDITSAGFEGLCQAALRFEDGPGTFGAYARQRIRGAMIDEIRHIFGRVGTKRPHLVSIHASTDDGTEIIEQIRDHSLDADVEGAVIGKITQAELLGAIRNRKRRKMVRLHVIEGHTQVEIGRDLGVSGSRISQLLNQTYAALRE